MNILDNNATNPTSHYPAPAAVFGQRNRSRVCGYCYLLLPSPKLSLRLGFYIVYVYLFVLFWIHKVEETKRRVYGISTTRVLFLCLNSVICSLTE